MMVPVYQAAERGDFGPLHELLALLKRPYDEQPEMEAKYFRKVWKHRKPQKAATTRRAASTHTKMAHSHPSKMPQAQHPDSSPPS